MTPALCAYCGDPDAPDLEHIQPLSRGGGRDAANTTAACKRCNGSKGGRTPPEWFRSKAPQALVAIYHARNGAPNQAALALDIPDWWGNVRIDLGDDLWRRFGYVVATRGHQGRHSSVSRSTLIQEFIAWVLREPGAKMPKRPGPTRPVPRGPWEPIDRSATTDQDEQPAPSGLETKGGR